MKFFNLLVFYSVVFFLAGCSSSTREVMNKGPERDRQTVERQPSGQPDETSDDTLTRTSAMKIWAPKFVQTGLASGIMVEFTGVKKDKPLHARYAGIELRRYPPGLIPDDQSENQLTLNQKGNDFIPAPFDVERSEPIVLNTTINDVKQAFFKVAPGKYLLRQTKEWADQSYIGNVVVREGNYSVVVIPVRIPGAGQP